MRKNAGFAVILSPASDHCVGTAACAGLGEGGEGEDDDLDGVDLELMGDEFDSGGYAVHGLWRYYRLLGNAVCDYTRLQA